MGKERTKSALLLTFVCMGGIAVVMQTVLFREFLVVFGGNELSISLIFAFWLFGVTAGALIGALLSRYSKTGLGTYLGVFSLFVLGSPVYLILVRLARTLFEIPIGQNASFLTLSKATLLIAAPASFPIGFLFPIAGLLASHIGFGKRSIGALFTYEAIGATLGGTIFTFVLAGRIDPFNSIAVFLITAMLSAAALLFVWRKKKSALLFAFMGALLLTGMVLGVFSWLDHQTIKARWAGIAPGLDLLESRDTRYQNISVGLLGGQTSVYGNGQVFSSFPDPTTSEVQANFIACQHPSPKSALILGTGHEELVRFLLAHQITRLDTVETDQVAMEIVHSFLPSVDQRAFEKPGVRRFATDGRVYARTSDRKYDLILLGLPDPSTAMINRFYTVDFFRQLRTIMNPGAVVALRATSAVNYVGEQVGLYVGSLFQSLKNVFLNIVVVPGDTAWFFASDRQDTCTSDWLILQDRYLSRSMQQVDFEPVIFKMLLPPDRILHFQKGLEDFKHARLNTDARPVTYFYNLVLSDQFSGGQLRTILNLGQKIGRNRILLLILIAGFVLAYAVYATGKSDPERSRKIGGTWLIFATGMAGMSLEIILILAYQNAHGAIFEKIGFMVALYMLGLAVGGGAMTARLGRGDFRPKPMLITTDVLMILLPVGIGMILGWIMPGFLYFILIFLVGTGAGLQFPLVASLISKFESDTGPTAGLVDWADHLGAFFGAALIGVFFVPLFGLSETCLIVCALKAASLAAVLTMRS